MKTLIILNSFSFKQKIFIFFLILLFFSIISEPLVSNAQIDHPYSIEKLSDIGKNKDFVVGPGKAELEINPGDTQIYPITVANRMAETKTFRIEVEDFIGSNNPEQAVVLLGDQRGPYSLKDYIFVPAYEFTLESGDRATIPVMISIPIDEEPGGRYGSVVVGTVSSKTEKEEGSAGTAIISRIGVLFFVKIPGVIDQQGNLNDFRTKAQKKIFGQNKIPFEIIFENSGTIHLNPYGEIRIKNWLGKEVGNIIVDPWFALPDSLRFREIFWERPYLMGMYTAEAFINRGYENIIDSASFTFFVIPWKLILIAVLAIAILVLLLRFILSRFEIKRKT